MSGQGKNANRQGARSNELYQLQALNRVVNAITGAGLPPSPTGLATESTLISVLNAISASDQDLEILLVRDTVTLIVYQQITNWQTGTPVVTYKDVNGTPFTPVNPMEYLDPSAVMSLVLTELLDQGLTLDSILTATAGLATEATAALINSNVVLGNITLNTIAPIATTLVSSSTTGSSSIPAGSKAASIFIEGAGGSINSVIRPDGWSQSFEFNNDTLPEITYNGNGTATMYIDILT
jgi:hypothetical protein